jgi:UDP-N-acetylglucosamine 2-epimerase (hydrolysing)
LNKRIIFVTGTRADFGKLKSLIIETSLVKDFDVYIFITGMHNNPKYGNTYLEVQRLKNVKFKRFKNETNGETMDLNLSNTINGFSAYVSKINPDLIVVHGDRPEPLACAIVGSFRNILVAHIEGGEVSGTIDELIRHSITKLSHIHFVSNKEAETRLKQMGEKSETIFTIGSPDVDLMFSDNLPTLSKAKNKYDISFENYSICLFHPVTTEIDYIKEQVDCLINVLIKSKKNYILIYPNNDLGSKIIIDAYHDIRLDNMKILPSLRFEYFLTILKNSEFIIGNSSAGIREAPYYSINSINLGSRQNKRDKNKMIINSDFDEDKILNIINNLTFRDKTKSIQNFGTGKSSEMFVRVLKSKKIWETNNQKEFQDIDW